MIKANSPPLQGTIIRWLPAQNQNAQACPPYGLATVVSVDAKGLYTVDQPTVDGQSDFVATFTGIPASNATPGAVTQDFPWWAAYDSADGTPVVGDLWGAKAGSWLLGKGRPQYLVLGVDTTRKVAMVTDSGAGGSQASIYVNNGTPNADGTYDARIEIIDTHNSLALSVGSAAVWLFDPNKPGALKQGQIFNAYFFGTYNSRALYIRDDFRLRWLTSAGTLNTDFVNAQQIGKDSNNSDDFIVTGSGRTATLRTAGQTGVGNFYRYQCSGGNLVELSAPVTVGDGLVKAGWPPSYT